MSGESAGEPSCHELSDTDYEQASDTDRDFTENGTDDDHFNSGNDHATNDNASDDDYGSDNDQTSNEPCDFATDDICGESDRNDDDNRFCYCVKIRFFTYEEQERLALRLHRMYPDMCGPYNPLYFWLEGIKEYERFLDMAIGAGPLIAWLAWPPPPIERIWRAHHLDREFYNQTMEKILKAPFKEGVEPGEVYLDVTLSDDQRGYRYWFMYDSLSKQGNSCLQREYWWPYPEHNADTVYPWTGKPCEAGSGYVTIQLSVSFFSLRLEVPKMTDLDSILDVSKQYFITNPSKRSIYVLKSKDEVTRLSDTPIPLELEDGDELEVYMDKQTEEPTSAK